MDSTLWQTNNDRAIVAMKRVPLICGIIFSGFLLLLLTLCFFPPVRDSFFSMSLWPWPLPTDITQQQINTLQSLSRPGDVIVETNMHDWQWVGLSFIFTGSSWVHASLVDENGKLLTVASRVEELPISIYRKWHSTRVVLVRPTYSGQKQLRRALAYGHSELGIPYDPYFENPNASCTGIVAESLEHAGISVPSTTILGRKIYAARTFLCLPGIKIIWTSDENQSLEPNKQRQHQ